MLQSTKEEEMFPILITRNYGGWDMSLAANLLYDERQKKKYGSKKIPIRSQISFRSDPLLIGVFEELGVAFNETYCKAELVSIPKKYKSYCNITEYDGLESIQINYEAYNSDCFLEKIKTILYNNEIQDGEKIKEIKECFDFL